MRTIGRYVVVDEIMSTQFADLFLAMDPETGARLAVKIFGPKGEYSDEARPLGRKHWLERFLREGDLLGRVAHPNIVPVRDRGITDDDRPFFVMPYLPANLHFEIGEDRLDPESPAAEDGRRHPHSLPVGRTVQFLRQILDAVAYLHRQAIVHRDLKPGNLLLSGRRDGAIMLCDFGMAKFLDWSISLHGTWMGTADYAAPEQRWGAQEVDARADVYSAGAIAYRMLTGTLPAGVFPAPRDQAPEVPAALSDLVMRCLAREPEERPADGGALLKLLDEACRDGGIVRPVPLLLRAPVTLRASRRDRSR